MGDWNIIVRSVDGDRAAFLPLLLEADESESLLRSYVNDGELLEIVANGEPVGVVLLTSPALRTVEIKNVAIENRYRGRGIGRAAIACLVTRAKDCGADRLLWSGPSRRPR